MTVPSEAPLATDVPAANDVPAADASSAPVAAAGATGLRVSDRYVVGVLVTVAVALFVVAARLRLNAVPSGDEPAYLVIGQALINYGSVDPTPAYENRDYWSYYPYELEAHVYQAANGRNVPLHNFGGPLLWLIPFMLWERAGAHLVMIAVSALIVGNVYYLQRELGIVRGYAALVTALFAIGTPLYVYASMLFIEPMGALIVIYAVRVILARAPVPWRVALASAGLGYAPWVHGRLALFSAILGALLIGRVVAETGRRSAWPYVWCLAPMGALFLTLETFHFLAYASLSPAPGVSAYGESLMLKISPVEGLAYLSFDRRFGLFPHFPILLLALPGIFLAWRRRSAQVHLVLAAAIVPYVLTISTFKFWWAGYTPAARFLAVIAPLLAFFVAVTLQRLHHWLATAVATLLGLFSLALSVASDVVPLERFHYEQQFFDRPMSRIEALTGVRFAHLFPMALRADSATQFGVWIVVAVALTTLVWLLGRRTPAGRLPDPALRPFDGFRAAGKATMATYRGRSLSR